MVRVQGAGREACGPSRAGRSSSSRRRRAHDDEGTGTRRGHPGHPANADHLLIGPAGVILVDSKRYSGSVSQTADGRVWHNGYPMDQRLGALRLEAEPAWWRSCRPATLQHASPPRSAATGGGRGQPGHSRPGGAAPGRLTSCRILGVGTSRSSRWLPATFLACWLSPTGWRSRCAAWRLLRPSGPMDLQHAGDAHGPA